MNSKELRSLLRYILSLARKGKIDELIDLVQLWLQK